MWIYNAHVISKELVLLSRRICSVSLIKRSALIDHSENNGGNICQKSS